MTRQITSVLAAVVAIAAFTTTAQAEVGWSGKRPISFQRPNDLFYNYYVGPEPSGTAAEMYVSPMPVPERVGHTYGTYQPWYPHEMMYPHCRSYWTHHPGAGWTRTKVRYSNCGYYKQARWFALDKPGFLPFMWD